MDLSELKQQHYRELYLFNPASYGRIFVFVDYANVRQWAKCFWPKENKEHLIREIDIAKLSEVIGFIDPVEKYFYYGYFKHQDFLPEDNHFNVQHRKSISRIDKARKSKFIVRTKEIKTILTYDEHGASTGRLNKCNFDIEMAMDMLTKIDQYDTVFLWSGDSDFNRLLQYLRSKGKKVITTCARGFTSEELRNNTDLFIPADGIKNYIAYQPKTNPPKP